MGVSERTRGSDPLVLTGCAGRPGSAIGLFHRRYSCFRLAKGPLSLPVNPPPLWTPPAVPIHTPFMPGHRGLARPGPDGQNVKRLPLAARLRGTYLDRRLADPNPLCRKNRRPRCTVAVWLGAWTVRTNSTVHRSPRLLVSEKNMRGSQTRDKVLC